MSYSYNSNSESEFDREAPVELGQEYEGEIEDLSRKGDGIAKIEGFVIFVPNTKKGEHVKFKIMKIGRRFAVAEIVQA
jgi:predicted RNA-binding protein with TRAM domain